MNEPWSHRGNGELVILDNRDSFVFNLAHRFWECGVHDIAVVRSDEISVDELGRWRPAALVISPGPGHPDDAGVSQEAIGAFHGRVPILGVCLGHQAIVTAFGGVVRRNEQPCHGRATRVAVERRGALFAGVPDAFDAGRYHSLAAVEPLPESLVATARGDGLVMALEHRDEPVFGVQFHPESVLTKQGFAILTNFARIAGLVRASR